MRIWFDISHVAQLNFYKKAIENLSHENDVIVSVLDRGGLLKIAKKELKNCSNCQITVLGKHLGNKYSTILDANIKRLFIMIRFANSCQPDVSIGNGFLHGIVAKLFKFPSIMFNDDVDRKWNRILMNLFGTEINYTTGSFKNTSKTRKINIFNALKEWAYLSPNNFAPNPKILNCYGLEPYQYIFVREVISGTFNYANQNEALISTISGCFPKDLKVILSLENKNLVNLYPDNWIVLKEPLEDIHSLIYFSKILVSSGDSMAREGAVLGVPSIYCGIREMKANTVLIEMDILKHVSIDEVCNNMRLMNESFNLYKQKIIRDTLTKEWIEVSNYIINRIEKVNQK